MSKLFRLVMVLAGIWVIANTHSFFLMIVAAVLVCGAVFL